MQLDLYALPELDAKNHALLIQQLEPSDRPSVSCNAGMVVATVLSGSGRPAGFAKCRSCGNFYDIDLKLLRSFCCIVEEGSFTSAQAALNLSQSALSEYLKSLEIRLGTQPVPARSLRASSSIRRAKSSTRLPRSCSPPSNCSSNGRPISATAEGMNCRSPSRTES